jgi:hypothetical protein
MSAFKFANTLQPTLTVSNEEARFLDAIQLGGVTRGSVAMRRARISGSQFLEAAKRLAAARVINTAGNLSDELQAQYAMFSLNPGTNVKLEIEPPLPTGLTVSIK